MGLFARLETLEFLIPKFPHTPTLYALPKTQKNIHTPDRETDSLQDWVTDR